MATSPTPSNKDDNKNSHEATPGEGLNSWWEDFIDLREGSDRVGATTSILSGKQMRGSNAWMLVCSIMIASLGLNLNSGAVIIGAMLISPLMNPILGVGLGIGTNDKENLTIALKNFGVSIAIALVTSVIYFLLTPIHVFTPEMVARTEPTILDALVAVFGGLAGIISVTRKDKTNAIPGVAIATALMPPLCVAGYGLALCMTDFDQGLHVFWRAFYLFFLNSFFIAVTAYLIIRLLRFPYKKYLTKQDARKSQIIIGIISLIMIAPGAYILTNVLTKLKEDRIALQFTRDFFPSSESTYSFVRDENNVPLLVYPVKDRLLDRDSIAHYTERLRSAPYGLKNARIVTDTSFTASQMAGIQNQLSDLQTVTERINQLERRQLADEINFTSALDSLRQFRMDSTTFATTVKQLQIAFPYVETVAISRARFGDRTDPYQAERHLVALEIASPGRRPTVETSRNRRTQLQNYLQEALRVDTVVLVIQER